MFRWDDIRIFLTVFREQNFSKAAHVLGVNQSTISRRVAALESSLSLQLFDRTPEGLVPTEAAKMIVSQAEITERSMHDLARLLDGCEQELEGIVRVAVPDGLSEYVLAPALGLLYERAPRIGLELIVGNQEVDLLRREADLAVCWSPPQQKDLIIKRLAVSDYGIYGNPGYLKDKRGYQPGDLDWLTWGGALSHLPESRWYDEEIGGIPRLRTANAGTLLHAAISGNGVMVLPTIFGRQVGELEALPYDGSLPFQLEIWLVGHSNLKHIPRIRTVWNFVEELIGMLSSNDSEFFFCS